MEHVDIIVREVESMNKKIMFFDIDGTILTEDTHEIPESTKKAIQEARSKGNLAFINTGRTYFNIEKEIRDIGFDGYVCGCGTYVQVGDELVSNITLEKKACREIIDLLRKHKIDAVLEGIEDVYFDTTTHTTEMTDLKGEFQAQGFGLKKTWDDTDFVYDKLYSRASDEADIDMFIKELGDGYDYIDRGNRFGEITPKGYSKAKGISILLDYYGLTVEDAYVFGDSSNDLAMFELVPNSVALKKCDDCIREKASFITRDIHDDGIYHGMKHYGLI